MKRIFTMFVSISFLMVISGCHECYRHHHHHDHYAHAHVEAGY